MPFCDPADAGSPKSDGHHGSPGDIGFIGSMPRMGSIGFIGSMSHLSAVCAGFALGQLQ